MRKSRTVVFRLVHSPQVITARSYHTISTLCLTMNFYIILEVRRLCLIHQLRPNNAQTTDDRQKKSEPLADIVDDDAAATSMM